MARTKKEAGRKGKKRGKKKNKRTPPRKKKGLIGYVWFFRLARFFFFLFMLWETGKKRWVKWVGVWDKAS